MYFGKCQDITRGGSVQRVQLFQCATFHFPAFQTTIPYLGSSFLPLFIYYQSQKIWNLKKLYIWWAVQRLSQDLVWCWCIKFNCTLIFTNLIYFDLHPETITCATCDVLSLSHIFEGDLVFYLGTWLCNGKHVVPSVRGLWFKSSDIWFKIYAPPAPQPTFL